jgi:aarF domain-containing kinase
VLVSPDLKFTLIDVGIVTKHSDEDHRLISNILAAFIRKQGRKAGRYMIDDSNSRLLAAGDHALDEELFIDKIALLTEQASGKDYFMEHLGIYISYICNAAAQHHVMVNQTFISAALSVKVEEGIALALDPSIEIWRVAIPIILEGERRHGLVGKRAKEYLGIEGFFDWINGGSTSKEKTSGN